MSAPVLDRGERAGRERRNLKWAESTRPLCSASSKRMANGMFSVPTMVPGDGLGDLSKEPDSDSDCDANARLVLGNGSCDQDGRWNQDFVMKLVVPTNCYHYYEQEVGPFASLSQLPMEDAERILGQIRAEGTRFASKRAIDYVRVRTELEQLARGLFIDKGGKPKTSVPYYLTLGRCEWLVEWYNNGAELGIPLSSLDPLSVSFTYGDLFPTMRYADAKPYRKKTYMLEEIGQVIDEYGLPQEWNRDGKKGPERYIEVQLWDEEPIIQYLRVS
jgi:hypothetical protein